MRKISKKFYVCLTLITFALALGSCIHLGGTTSAPKPRVGLYFKVRAGQNTSLRHVAKVFNVPTSRIRNLNSLPSRNRVKPGTILVIPVSTYALKSPRIRKDFPLFNLSTADKQQALAYLGDRSMAWPLDGLVTWGYGLRSGKPHEGIDIVAKSGTPIRASNRGKVEFAGWISGYGNTVIVDHKTFKTLYAHCSRITVRKNQMVRQGSLLGLVGTTGNAEGPHLHFETRTVRNRSMDPLSRLPAVYGH